MIQPTSTNQVSNSGLPVSQPKPTPKQNKEIPKLSEIAFKALEKSEPRPHGWHEQLENGMELCLDYQLEHKKEPFVSCTVVIKTGHLAEELDKKELQFSHAVEHAVFLGTKEFTYEGIREKLASLKCSFIQHAYASTNLKHTNYSIKDIPLKHAEEVLKLLFQLVAEASFPPELIEKEREIIRNELFKRENHDMESVRHSMKELYPGTNISASSTAKDFHQDIKNLDAKALAEKLKDFYVRWYRPHHMALIVSGNFHEYGEAKLLFGQMKEIFSPIKTAKDLGIKEERIPPVSISKRTDLHVAAFSHSQFKEAKARLVRYIKQDKKAELGKKTSLEITQHCRQLMINRIAINLFSTYVEHFKAITSGSSIASLSCNQSGVDSLWTIHWVATTGSYQSLSELVKQISLIFSFSSLY